MRRWAFAVALLGIGVLFLFFMSREIRVDNYEEIEKLELNTKVILSGVVESERVYSSFRIMDIDGINVICECDESFLGKEVELLGVVSEYEGKKQVTLLRIYRS